MSGLPRALCTHDKPLKRRSRVPRTDTKEVCTFPPLLCQVTSSHLTVWRVSSPSTAGLGARPPGTQSPCGANSRPRSDREAAGRVATCASAAARARASAAEGVCLHSRLPRGRVPTRQGQSPQHAPRRVTRGTGLGGRRGASALFPGPGFDGGRIQHRLCPPRSGSARVPRGPRLSRYCPRSLPRLG